MTIQQIHKHTLFECVQLQYIMYTSQKTHIIMNE